MNKRDRYNRYIASAEWRAKRQEIAEERNFKCEKCGCDVRECGFEVHHKTYIHFGAEKDNELKLLCVKCHKQLHAEVKNRKKKIHKYSKI